MEISGKLVLHGFTRINAGDRGAVFVRYETPRADDRKAEVRESPMYYGGKDYVSYMVNIPKPRTAAVTGVVIVERTSKNRYRVSAWAGGTIENFSTANTDEIVRTVNGMLYGGGK